MGRRILDEISYLVEFQEDAWLILGEPVLVLGRLRRAILQIVDFEWAEFAFGSWTIVATRFVFVLIELGVRVDCNMNN